MQGKTDYIPKNFCIRAYQLNSYWFVLRNSDMRTPMETLSFQRFNVCEEVNRFVNWILRFTVYFLISSTKGHEQLAFISAKATNSKIFGCIGFGWLWRPVCRVRQVHPRVVFFKQYISNKGLKTALHSRDLVDFCHTLEEAKNRGIA